MPRINLVRAFGLALLSFSAATSAEVKLPAIFKDHMVLQQATDVPIWGWADPDEMVEIRTSWSSDPSVAITDKNGAWRTTIKTPAASPGTPPSTIQIKGSSTIKLSDVLIGEVWLCSGQSNMEMFVSNADGVFGGVDRWQDELKSADIPDMRVFDVKNAIAAGPQKDCEGTWEPCTADRVKKFSATAFFFGRQLHRELKVPIGLISSDWGGTPAESWTSAKGLAPFSEFRDELFNLSKIRDDPGGLRRVGESATNKWRSAVGEIDEHSVSGPGGFMRRAFNDSNWPTVHVPGTLDGENADHDGFFWLRTAFQLPAAAAGKPAVLSLGPIDDCDTVWINDILVGETLEDGKWGTPRTYTVPEKVLIEGMNIIVVRVLDTGGNAGMTGKPEQYVLKPAALDAQPVMLAGEWRCKKGIELSSIPARPKLPSLTPWSPSTLYNGMIAPIARYAIRGAIWYQGESNRDRAYQYRTLFPAMIKDWRANWEQGDFPFYFVQIAPFNYGGDTGQAAELREAQSLAQSLTHCGMAVTMDIGDPKDIHPRNKQEVGRRLSLLALNQTYGKSDVECSGPVYKAIKIENGKAVLSFDKADGLTSGDNAPTCFTIAGDDKVFVPAQCKIDGTMVTVWSDKVPSPVAVRYGWGAADNGTLKNKASLPASSFRTDSWEELTKPKSPPK